MARKVEVADRYVYEFTGEFGDEDFPEPPISRRLVKGDRVESDEPIAHDRLALVAGPPTKKQSEEEKTEQTVEVKE